MFTNGLCKLKLIYFLGNPRKTHCEGTEIFEFEHQVVRVLSKEFFNLIIHRDVRESNAGITYHAWKFTQDNEI